jgi:DNA-binding Lrp family transcriptional regulator
MSPLGAWGLYTVNVHISDIESKILAVLQAGLPKSASPYKDMAQRAGIDTRQLLAILEDWKRQGKLRRIGAIVNHFNLGLDAGAMVVWQVDPAHIEKAGKTLAQFKEVSHAYERKTTKNWPYNIYSMVHGTSFESLQQTIRLMSEACNVSIYRVLITEKELKKVPPTYVTLAESQSIKEQG